MTAYGTTQTAIEAMKLGAYDYLLKPFDVPKLKEIVANALKAARDMKQVVSYQPLLESEDYELGIVGRSEAMQQVFKLIGQVAAQQRHRADHRRKRHRQGTGRPRHLSSQQPQRPAVPGHQLRRHSRATCWKANCSATNAARSPARPRSASANSSNATTARFFWTKSAT